MNVNVKVLTTYPPENPKLNYFEWCQALGVSRLSREAEDKWKVIKEAYEHNKKSK